jgi:hypothetical protein
MNSIIETNYGPALHWTVAEDKEPRPPALQVVLHKRTYIFPWSRFIYAEGSSDEIVISFATHEVLVTGYGLDHLLADIAAHCVVSLHEPNRADNFRAANEAEPKAAFRAIVVRPVVAEE